jgi:outer membrane protein TolC
MRKDREPAVMGLLLVAALLIAGLGLAGCALHPRGEREERDLARQAYEAHVAAQPAPLAADASLREILDYAYASNANLKRLYWDWAAALEAIPQDASPGTDLAVSGEVMFEEGKTSLSRTTLGLGNDPMAGLPWPGKLATAGKMSLEMARAAGSRFLAGKLDLRAKVLVAYYAYALVSEELRLKTTETALAGMAAEALGARVQAGAASTADVLEAWNRRDLALNDLTNLKARVPASLAGLNALLGRDVSAPLDLPRELPPARELPYTDAEILAFLAERNPDLAAMAHEVAAGERNITLMRQQYIPDLGLTVSGDLEGITKSIMAMLTTPILRHEAIEASIRQARAGLEASRAARLQAERDLTAETVLMLYDLRAAERQVELYDGTILPRLARMVETAETAYSTGQAGFAELVDSRLMLIEMKRMTAEMRMERETMLARLEAMAPL